MASGQDMGQWEDDVTPHPTSFPGLVTRNGHDLLAFDGATQETCYARGRVPDNYAGGGLTLSLLLAAASATTGTCVFEAAFERNAVAGDDIDADSFAADQNSGAVTVAGTAGVLFEATITFSSGANMDNLAAGDHFRLRIRRAPANGSDTVTTDVQLMSARLRET